MEIYLIIKKFKKGLMITSHKILITLFFFFLVGLCEIGGGYSSLALAEGRYEFDHWSHRRTCFIFVCYCSTFQPSHFHRIYAAYGGIFIIMSVLWGWLFEGIAPDRFDTIGTIVAVIGVIIIYYMPRKGEEKTIWQ